MLGTRNPNHYNPETPGVALKFGVKAVKNIEAVKPVENVEKVKDVKEEVKEVKEEVEVKTLITKEEAYDLTKEEQTDMLKELGLSKKEVKQLKSEADRVAKILELCVEE